MRYIDLFAGIGGFHYGLKGHECVYSSEWDKYANSVYRKHFGECDSRDIRTVDASSLPDFDLLCAGFPCQAFSIAGKRRGFEDTRGTLFFDVARILSAKQPRLCLLENVKGLLSHDDGRTIKTIFATLTELGYDCQWQVCNSKDFGVPQNRERIFIVGHLRGTPRPEVFPLTSGYPEITQEQSANAITSTYWKGWDNHGERTQIAYENTIEVGTLRTHKDGNGFRKVESGLAPTIPARARNDGSGQPVVMAWSKSHRTGKSDADKRRYNYGTVEERIKIGEFNTLNTGTGGSTQSSQNFIAEQMRIRRLTPVECERLQGFPDNWTKYGADGELISDTQRYKMCGNAVSTPVITAIAERLLI